MSNLSSIHFKKSTRFQVYHNDKIRPSYVIDSVDKVECNRPSEEARLLCDDMIEKAKQRYYETSKARNKNFQATNYLQSAVVNIKESTTMDDLEKLANKLNEVYKFQCYQISIHRDEGHIAENGEKIYNHHAHLEFVTLDKETGKSCFRLNKADLRKIQDITAQELGMERGNPGAKRIEPRAYAQLKEQEKANTRELRADLEKEKATTKALKQELASQKAVNTAFEEIRQLMIADKISTADDYKELAKYKKQAVAQQKQGLTQAELDKLIAQIQLSYDEKLKLVKEQELAQLKSEMNERSKEELKNDLDIYLNQAETPKDKELVERILILNNLYVSNARIDINKLKNENDSLKNKLADNKPNSQNKSDEMKKQILTLENENKQLKAENQTLKKTIKKLSTLKEYIATYFHDAVSKYLSYMKNTNKLDDAIDIEPKEQQLTAKKEPEKPKNRGFSRC